MNTQLDDRLLRFFEAFINHEPAPATEWDPEWPSPCEIGDPFTQPGLENPLIQWQPVPRHSLEPDFRGLENALGAQVHPDIKAYYGHSWSDNITVTAPDGACSLLFLWSPKDLERLIENLVGHLFACQVNKTPFSVFFACTIDPDDYYLTVNNETGVVQLEAPAKMPIKEIAPDLATFIETLTFNPNPT